MNELINSTLCYIEKDGRYLMLYRNKKKNDPCEGKWVGVGGKFEPGESADECLLREVWEETGLKLTRYQFCGVIHFVSDTWPDEDMYLYTADEFDGDDSFADYSVSQRNPDGDDINDRFICNEGELRWISKDEILQLNLWDGDRYFLEPLISGNKKLHMTCRYEGHKCVEVRNEDI